MKRVPALLAAAAMVVAAGWTWTSWFGAGPSGQPVSFLVADGASVSRVAADLEAKGLIRSSSGFRLFARILGGGDPVQAGEFAIPAGASPSAILDLLQHGRPAQRLLTIPEGLPSVLVQERLAALPLATGVAPLPAEGRVLPDSYGYERGESRAAILARMTAAMDRELDKAWSTRKGDCPVASKEEALVLASIVEKETGKPSERRAVAAVYCNRLKIGMKLDADPTVIYPITKGRPLGRRIRKSELNAITGYNTYRERGLPKGPIANPGRESIAAVLNPAQSQALYFVADGSGGHVFAQTLAEHQANVAKWYAIRRQRGEM